MSRITLVAASCVAAGVVLTLSGRAHAEEEAAPASAELGTAPPPDADVKDSLDGRPEDDPFRPIALTANPLSLILTRIGVNVEYLPATHHAIVVNPFGQFISVGDPATVETSYSNFGAELGYRFYTGERGANGFFVGPFLTFVSASFTSKSQAVGGGQTEASASFFSYGGGLDLGGQHVFQNGLTLGGGVGAMYLIQSASAGASSDTVKFEGVLPRFLATVGYSF